MGLLPKEKLLAVFKDKVVPRLRPIGALLLVGAFVFVLSFPMQARQTYISENGLVINQGATVFTEADLSALKRFNRIVNSSDSVVSAICNATEVLLRLNAETQTVSVVRDLGDGLITSTNVYTIVPSYRGQGTEAIVLAAGYDPSLDGDQTSVGLVLSLAKVLQRVHWLQKDVVLLFYDRTLPYIGGARAFADAYHGVFDSSAVRGGRLSKRAGLLIASIVVDVHRGGFERVEVAMEGTNGQLPNLDLVNLVDRTSGRIPARLASEHDNTTTLITRLARAVGAPQMYAKVLQGFANFMTNQARALPTGDHGAFIPYRIDAVTVRGVGTPTNGRRPTLILARLGMTLESCVRSLSNLLEHLHQSFYYYLLPMLGMYFSYGEYIPPLFMVVAAAVSWAVKLYVDANAESRLLRAVAVSAACHVTCFTPIALTVLAGSAAAALTPLALWAVWVGLSVLCVGVLLTVVLPGVDGLFPTSASATGETDWMLLKAVGMLEFAAVCFCLSLLNFSFAFGVLFVFTLVAGFLRPYASTPVSILAKVAVVALHPVVLPLLVSTALYANPLTIVEGAVAQFMWLPTLPLPFVLFVFGPVQLVLTLAVCGKVSVPATTHVKSE